MNHCLRHCQRARPDSVPYEEQALPDEDWQGDPVRSAVKQELSEQVKEALNHLSPLHSDVVILCELHGLTYRECASILEIPIGTVKSRLSNAFRRLRTSGQLCFRRDGGPAGGYRKGGSTMSNCEQLRDDLKAYADGQLPPAPRLAVRMHLAHCAACREEIEIMEAECPPARFR